MDLGTLILVFLAFAFGGLLKGATGAGAPILAVPLMVMLRDIQFAVAVFVLPNVLPNLWQFWQTRDARPEPVFLWRFAAGGGIGALLGTVALAGWDPDLLTAILAAILAAYILFRLARPNWVLSFASARRIVLPVSIAAGALQGAAGLSAPVSMTYLNAIRLERRQFMATISLFFAALGLFQLPLQLHFGIMTGERFLYSALSLVPLFLFMPVGGWVGRRMSPRAFDRVILVVLAILALKLGTDSLF